MPYLIAAVILLSLFSVGHMVVTLGLVRRMRTMATETGSAPTAPPTLAIGESPAEFAATAESGRRFQRSGLSGGRNLVGFFSTTCEPCLENAPRFAEYARSFEPGRVLAVIQDGEPGAAKAFHENLLPGVEAVVEKMDGPVARAFAVEAFPTMYVLDSEGRVEHFAFTTARLPQPAAA
ncbi:thiol-disulfide isomerase/thioredoxin [Catenulispora sp. MAP5-51]